MKSLKWMAVPLMALTFSTFFYACGEPDEIQPKTNNSNSGSQGSKDNDGVQNDSITNDSTTNDSIISDTTIIPPVKPETLTPEAHKERLNQIGADFLNMIPESDFRELLDLGEFIAENYFDDDEKLENIDEWAKGCFDALISSILPEERKEDTYTYNNWNNSISYYHYIDIYQYTCRIYQLNKFRAHLLWNEAQKKWIVQESANDLQAICKDQSGRQLTLTLTHSGNTKKVYVGKIKEGNSQRVYDNWLDDADNYHTSYTYTSKTDVAYVEVPENINVTLTRGNETLVSVQVKTDLSSMTKEDFDLSKDAFTVSVTAKFAGYEIQTARVSAKVNTNNGVTANVNIFKKGQKLFAAEIKGNVDINASDLIWNENTDNNKIEKSFKDATGSVSVVNIDILGQLQVTAACSNPKKLSDYLKEANDNCYEESKVVYDVQEANKLFDARFFYDGSKDVQGTLELEAFSSRSSYGTKFNVEPIIIFSDGSRYSLINETFFSNENFKNLTKLFEKLTDRYENLIKEYD